MRRSGTIGMAMLFMLCVSSNLWGQAEIPKALKDVAPAYSGAQVMMGMDSGDQSHAVLETKDSPKAVLEFYKKSMTGKGWKVEMEMTHGSGQMISFSKDGKAMNVVASPSSQGKTTVTLTLGKQ
jgi:hypothetical protein